MKQKRLKNSADFVENFSNAFFWKNNIEKSSDVMEFSSNIEFVTGYSSEEILNLPGRKWGIVFEEDSYQVRKIFTDFLSLSSSDEVEFIYRLEKKNQEIIWVKEKILAERDKRNKHILLYGSVLDITEEKISLENLTKDVEHLRNINASKDKFISMLSHDLRSPFTSILGFSEILMSEPNLSEIDKKEYLNYIHSSSQNQLQFINYLLDWSRLQTGKIKLEMRRLNAQFIVYNCIASLTGNIIRKNIEIKVDISDSLHVKADERLLTQVITNLISNSIKFSDDYKSINISADIFNDDYVEFIIKDEGIGISEKNKTKLFRMERLFSTEGTKGERGTGLGLSLVKEIVDKHKGEVWFYSEKGVGSEFHITIPFSQNSILLIDDDKNNRIMIEEIIKDKFPFYEILNASNGYEAIQYVSSKPPSLIITDHEMPLMNGIQFIETLKSDDRNLRIPIIAALSNASDELKQLYKTAGARFIFQKPVDEELFAYNLETVLN
jgi:PAS domain S-box-containing protein